MPAPPPLFAGNPASPRIQQLHADLEQSYMRPVSILDLNHLPTPDATRRAQRETEVFGLRCELEAIEFMIATAAQNPAFYPEQLSLLYADRRRYEARIAELEQKGGQAL